MNSFWIPADERPDLRHDRNGNTLHLIADGPGEYKGRAVEINGDGYGDMTFKAKSSTQADFDAFVKRQNHLSLIFPDDALNRAFKARNKRTIILYSLWKKNYLKKLL